MLSKEVQTNQHGIKTAIRLLPTSI